MANKQKTIEWKYCECGCKGFDVWLGQFYFWYFDDLGRGGTAQSHHLYSGHRGKGHVGDYSSKEEMEQALRRRLKPMIEAVRQRLNEAETYC